MVMPSSLAAVASGRRPAKSSIKTIARLEDPWQESPTASHLETFTAPLCATLWFCLLWPVCSQQ